MRRICSSLQSLPDGVELYMHYLISDVHNDIARLREILRQISFSEGDRLFILGDLFDRSSHAPDPVGVYFTILGLGNRCTVLRGNHDEWLAQYILDYYCTPERKRKNTAIHKHGSDAKAHWGTFLTEGAPTVFFIYIGTSTVGDTVEVMSADKARQLPIFPLSAAWSCSVAAGAASSRSLPSAAPLRSSCHRQRSAPLSLQPRRKRLG